MMVYLKQIFSSSGVASRYSEYPSWMCLHPTHASGGTKLSPYDILLSSTRDKELSQTMGRLT